MDIINNFQVSYARDINTLWLISRNIIINTLNLLDNNAIKTDICHVNNESAQICDRYE